MPVSFFVDPELEDRDAKSAKVITLSYVYEIDLPQRSAALEQNTAIPVN